MDKLSLNDINHNVKYNTLNGVFAVLASNLVMPFVSVLAMNLGASNSQIGLLSSLPPAVSLAAMLPGAFFVERFALKKNIAGLFIFLHRTFFLLLALTPFLPRHQVWFLVGMYGLMNLPGSIAGVAWQSFIAGAIPSEHRAQAFASRNRVTSLVGIAITFAAGQIFRLTPDSMDLVLYQIFFVTAFGLALLEVWYHLNMREAPAITQRSQPGLGAMLGALGRERGFLVFCGCSLLFHFGWQMGWPLFSIHQVRNLGADETWISWISVVNGGMSFLTYSLWAKFIQKKGNHFVLFVAAFGISLSPFLYAASTQIIHVVFINGIIGIAIAGISLSLFNSLLDSVPEEGRTVYIASYTFLINLSATVVPMIGIGLLERFGMIPAMLVAGTFRMLGSAAFALRYMALAKSEAKKKQGQPAA